LTAPRKGAARKKAASPRKAQGAGRIAAKKKAPARKRTVAAAVGTTGGSPRLNRPLRAVRLAPDARPPRPLQAIRMTADGPALRPLRARRVETGGAPNGASPNLRPRTSPIAGAAVQFRVGGPNDQEFPGFGV
jgi:hypothetical protein